MKNLLIFVGLFAAAALCVGAWIFVGELGAADRRDDPNA